MAEFRLIPDSNHADGCPGSHSGGDGTNKEDTGFANRCQYGQSGTGAHT